MGTADGPGLGRAESGDGASLVGLNPCRSMVPPDMEPPKGCYWVFLAGVWALLPLHGQTVGNTLGTHIEVAQDDYQSVDKVSSEMANDDKVIESDIEGASNNDVDSEDSVSEFERNLRELLPNFQGSSSTGITEFPKGSRRSERHKKPSTRFNEDAGYLPEPPRSTKKKLAQDEALEGTQSKPLLISDWSNAQLVNYCNDCGITFSDAANECLNNIRAVELAGMKSFPEQAETSVEVRGQ